MRVQARRRYADLESTESKSKYLDDTDIGAGHQGDRNNMYKAGGAGLDGEYEAGGAGLDGVFEVERAGLDDTIEDKGAGLDAEFEAG